MLKALIVASLAMLACCAAAALAGPVEPPAESTAADPPAFSHPRHPLPPLAGNSFHHEPMPALLDTIVFEGLTPRVPEPTGAASAAAIAGTSPDALAPLTSPTEAAVIPLPPAVYAGLATGAAVLALRRRILRTIR